VVAHDTGEHPADDARGSGRAIAMVGLGRMGRGMATRLGRAGHRLVVHDAVQAVTDEVAAAGGFTPAAGFADLAAALAPPRVVWVMVPAGVVGPVLDELLAVLEPGDVVVDGGNSHWRLAPERAARCAALGITFLDVGTSGGVHGLERGFCLMVGGDAAGVARVEPFLEALAPGIDAAPRTPGRTGDPTPAERGWLHCGASGAGHLVKMVHNGVEYGMMAAYAEGLALLDAAPGLDTGAGAARLEPPVGELVELWRRGSVVASWLLDLTAAEMATDPGLHGYSGVVGDSGEGRWTVDAAVEVGVPAHVISAALFERFASQGRAEFGSRVLSAMRHGFGGHVEVPSAPPASGPAPEA
jgi:6-phosphogluconate dehydrogenase